MVCSKMNKIEESKTIALVILDDEDLKGGWMDEVVQDIVDGNIIPSEKYKGVFQRPSTNKYECITPQQILADGDTVYNVYGDLVLIYGKAGFEGMGIAGLRSKDEMDAWMEAKRTKRA